MNAAVISPTARQIGNMEVTQHQKGLGRNKMAAANLTKTKNMAPLKTSKSCQQVKNWPWKGRHCKWAKDWTGCKESEAMNPTLHLEK